MNCLLKQSTIKTGFVLKAALVASIATAGSASAGLVGHWTFDSDYTSTTGMNNATEPVSGNNIDNTDFQIGGGSASFSGSGNSDEVVVGDIDLTGTGYTLMAWVLSDGNSLGNDYIAGKENAYHLGIRSSGTVWGSVRTDAGGNTFTPTGDNGSTIATTGNTWSHIVVVYDGTSLLRYVDGTLTGNAVANSGNMLPNDTDFKIGNDSGSANRLFVGNIDDVALFDEALSAADILAIYNGGLAGQNVAQVIPEPGSLALLGLGGLCLMRRRRD
ncbi:MAG: LamG domain-containing protein [Planctomycetota bacterium]